MWVVTNYSHLNNKVYKIIIGPWKGKPPTSIEIPSTHFMITYCIQNRNYLT